MRIKIVARVCSFLIAVCLSMHLWGTPAFCGEDPVESVNNGLDLYQKYISPVDGNRCSMYPTCSSYARESINKHGLIPGVVMSIDRLVRCGRDEGKWSGHMRIGANTYVYDPVENNDFWWDEK